MFAPISHLQAAEMELHQSRAVDTALAVLAGIGIVASLLAASAFNAPNALVLLPV